jgi:thioredoxin-related protein
MNSTDKISKLFSKRKNLFLALFFFPLFSIAQEKPDQGKGVQFEDNLSWAAIKAKAKAENKYIFLDGFTTWCGPCKYMKNTVFPQEECGRYFNEKFISVEVQLDTTKEDNKLVRSWYADAHAIMVEYNIMAFPTFLVFTPDGQAVHRVVGGSLTPKEFIARIENSFDPAKQYYTQLRKYQGGERDSSFLRKMAIMARQAYDMKIAEQVAKAYFATQSDLFNPGTLGLLSDFTSSTKDPGFDLFYHRTEDVDKVLGPGMAEKKIRQILWEEKVFHKIQGKTTAPDWDALQKSLAADYPAYADEVIATAKVTYYQGKHDWTNFQVAVVDFMKKYGADVPEAQLNSYAWTVFQNCPDMNCVTEALNWSKRSFKNNNEPSYMDTYANILYKMGKKDEAITWEEKARDLSSADAKKGYQDTIDKMKRGEKTWN